MTLRNLKIFFISLLFFSSLLCFAENSKAVTVEPIIIPLWQDSKPPVENGLPENAEVIENPGWISSVTKPELYVYTASEPNGMAIVMCPGGGYSGVAISHEGKELSQILNDNGISLIVVKYRMPNFNTTVPADDIREAFRIVGEFADEWGINPAKIGIGGASAGGHLASTIATHPKDGEIKPAFQFLLYPVISMQENVTHGGSRYFLLGENPEQEIIDYYSNELQVNPNTSPAFIALSADDNVVPVKNSIDYFNALVENNIPVSLHIYPTGGHGWGTNPEFEFSNEWKNEFIKWLDYINKDILK